jgi:hypothetical protein
LDEALEANEDAGLLYEYIEVYNGQIEFFEGKVSEAQANFEKVSEQKRLREEAETAAAAQKAKEE